jgi:hypothetical protein
MSTLSVPAMNPVSLNVKFGKVAFGSETISVSIALARGAVPTRDDEPAIAAADRLLTMRRLDVLLTNATEQGSLFAEHEDGAPIEVRTIVETAGLSVGGEKFSLTMNARQSDLEQAEMDEITHLAQREGRVIIYDVAAKGEPGGGDDAGSSVVTAPPASVAPAPPARHTSTLLAQFAAERLPGNRLLIGQLQGVDGSQICNDKQAAAFLDSDYATTLDVAALMARIADDEASSVLAEIDGISAACGKKVVAAVRKFVERHQKPLGRLLCMGCGELWDTFTRNDVVIGVEESRRMTRCPHCEDEQAAFRGVTDKRIDELGDWPDEVCERIDLAEIGGCKVGILLVQDEFGTWRHGVAIDLRGDLAGFSPRFSMDRNDRPSAVTKARSDAMHELRQLDDSDAAACLRAIAADKTPVV